MVQLLVDWEVDLVEKPHVARSDGRPAATRKRPSIWRRKKKADAAEHPEVFHRVGLLTNEPPGTSRVALYSVFRPCREAKD